MTHMREVLLVMLIIGGFGSPNSQRDELQRKGVWGAPRRSIVPRATRHRRETCAVSAGMRLVFS